MTFVPTTESLTGTTFHYVNGKAYGGSWTPVRSEPVPDFPGWAQIHEASGLSRMVKLEDCFATEAEARAAVTARRKPRTARRPAPVVSGGLVQAMQLGASR